MFEIKVNNGILKQGYYYTQLKETAKKEIKNITSYNELKVIYDTLDDYHKKLITKNKLSKRDEMDIYMNLKNDKIMKLLKTVKRGCFITFIFNL